MPLHFAEKAFSNAFAMSAYSRKLIVGNESAVHRLNNLPEILVHRRDLYKGFVAGPTLLLPPSPVIPQSTSQKQVAKESFGDSAGRILPTALVDFFRHRRLAVLV